MVVMPALGCEETAVAQLKAFRRQRCEFPFTVVVADGSTDDTARLAAQHCEPLG
jgi:glycosyltransferase involved in cell wall biosynthesis